MKGDLLPAKNTTRFSGLKHDGWECIFEYRMEADDNFISLENLDIDADGGEYMFETFMKVKATNGGALRFTLNGLGGALYSAQYIAGYDNSSIAWRESGQDRAYIIAQASNGVNGGLSFAKLNLRRIGTKYVYVAHSAGNIVESTKHSDAVHWSGEINANVNLTALGISSPAGNIGAGTLFRIYKRARLA